MNRSTNRWPRAATILTIAMLLATAVSQADSVNTTQRSVTKLADGIYTIRHKDAPDTFPQGNTTVIIGDDSVLVIDACYLPSSAREDITQIKQWTAKPVRFLLNTHWHYDHTMGNAAYRDAFPGLVIIAQTETRNQISGYNPGWFERFPERAATMQQTIDAGKDANGKTLTPADINDLKGAVAGIAPVWVEFKPLTARLHDLTPNVAFDREMLIDLGNREVQLKYLGRGNTLGDATAYLPKEKILITGDLLDHPVPYVFGGYPAEQTETLERMSLIDAQTIVPGHGEVLHDFAYVKQELALLRAVSEEVQKAIYRIGAGPDSFEAVRTEALKHLDVEALRRSFAGDDADNRSFFDDTFAGLLKAAFREQEGK